MSMLDCQCNQPKWPGLVTLTFELFTLKVVSESRVTWPRAVPILVFLPLCSRVTPMVTPDVRDRQTDVRQKHRLIPRLLGAGA